MKVRGRILALVMVLTLALSALGIQPAWADDTQHPFADMIGSPYEAQVNALWTLSLVNGVEQGRYSPSNTVTRAQMATFVIRGLGQTGMADAVAVGNIFSDVPKTHWAAKNITLANQLGIVTGDGTRFHPEDPVTYAQAATMWIRALGYENQVVGGFPTGYVLTAQSIGLLEGLSFDLNAPINRAEMARMMFNAVFSVKLPSGLTLSQQVHRHVVRLEFQELPTLVEAGTAIPLKYVGYDPAGNVISNPDAHVRVVSGNATIAEGALTPQEGSIVLQLYSDTAETRTTVTGVSGLTVEPATFEAKKGDTVQLKATGHTSVQVLQGTPTWRVVSGPATVDANGLVTINDYGAITVEASVGHLTAKSIGLSAGQVKLADAPSFVVQGNPTTFKALVTTPTGQVLKVPPMWTATNGQMDPATGTLVVTTGDWVTVKASVGSVADQITLPVLKSLAITPGTPSVLRGGRVKLSLTGRDANGKEYVVQPKWTVQNSNVGVVTTDGTFISDSIGTTVVTATVGSLVAQTQLTVAGPPVKMSLTGSATVTPAQPDFPVTVKIRLLDERGALSPVDDQPVTLQLTDSAGGKISRQLVLTKQGEATVTYTPSTSQGMAFIIADAPGTLIPAQNIGINTFNQIAHHIQLSVNPQPLAVGAGATVKATLLDASGLPAPAGQTMYLNLASTSPTTGYLASPVLTIPAGQSSGSVQFLSNAVAGVVSISGTGPYPVYPATLSVVQPGDPAGVRIRPLKPTTPIDGVSSLQVLVDVVDKNGVVRLTDNYTVVTLKVTSQDGLGTREYSASAQNGVATFSVLALSVGHVDIVATSSDIKDAKDTASTEFVPGLPLQVRLTSQTQNAPADGRSQIKVIAEVVDPNGVVFTSANPVISLRKLVDGGASQAPATASVQAQNGQATFILTSTTTPGTDYWYASAPGVDGFNLAKVTTTAPVGTPVGIRVKPFDTFKVNKLNTIEVEVVDRYGQVVASDNDRIITATHSLAGATVSASSPTKNGVATFTVAGTINTTGSVTFMTPGLQTNAVTVPVTFSDTGLAYSLFVSASSTSAKAGSAVTIWVRVMDQQGNVIMTDSGRLITAAVLSGNANVSPTQVVDANGVASFAVTGNAAGLVSLSFSAPGLTQPQAQIAITFTP